METNYLIFIIFTKTLQVFSKSINMARFFCLGFELGQNVMKCDVIHAFVKLQNYQFYRIVTITCIY